MSLSLVSAAIVAITLGAAPQGPNDPYSPSVEGKWELVVCMADGVPLELHMLEDTETHITDGVMTFPFFFRVPAVQSNRQLHFEFVENGLNVTYPRTSHTVPLKGTWSMHQQTFQFCYATDEGLGRPKLGAGKGLNYIMLKRSTRDAKRSAQETRSRAVAQLEEIVREDGSTEAGKKAKDVLKTLGYDVWCDGRVYPTGTFIMSGIPLVR